MKFTKAYILTAILALVLVPEYACSQNTMTNSPYTQPLKAGKDNRPVQFESLTIDPVNLFVQAKPWNNNSPNIQLEVNLTEGGTNYHTFIWYYETNHQWQVNNYPKAFGHYLLSLDINNTDVKLVVEKTAFDKVFVLDLNREANIEGLTVKYESCVTGNYVDPHGKFVGAFASYSVTLSDGGETETLYFKRRSENENKDIVLEWKTYTITVLYDSERFLKLKVGKKQPEALFIRPNKSDLLNA